MTSSISWIDPVGLASTLSRMGVGTGRARVASPEPLEPAEVVIEPITLKVEAPESLPEAGEGETPEVREATGAVEITDFVPVAGPLRDRLESFVAWMFANSGARAAFVIDGDGLPLIDRNADPSLLAIASSVLQLIETINGKLLVPLGKLVDIELERGLLALMTVETPIGKYIVGQVGPSSVPANLRKAIDSALRQVFQFNAG